LASCPLEGRAYVYLAKLDFLDAHGMAPSMQDCVAQALRVRPFDGAVLYAAASEAYLAGDTAKWLEYAKRAFHSGLRYERQLITDLIDHTAPEATPAMAAFLLHEFQPDLDGVRILTLACAKRCPPEQLVPLRRRWAQMSEDKARTMKEPDCAGPWLESLHVYQQLHEMARALDCAKHAVKGDPNNYQARFELAACLIQQKEFAEAETQLHWCLQRSPNDRNAESKLKEALQGRLDSQRRASKDAETRR
jgi:tetratricopeptide (TPR) repeat protein